MRILWDGDVRGHSNIMVWDMVVTTLCIYNVYIVRDMSDALTKYSFVTAYVDLFQSILLP